MVYTILLLLGAAFLLFCSWLQGRKHWIKASINAIFALVLVSAAISRFNSGNTSVLYPSIPDHSKLNSLNIFELAGLVIAISISVWAVIDWYRKEANKG